MLFPWCLLGVAFGIISLGISFKIFSGSPRLRRDQGLTSASIQILCPSHLILPILQDAATIFLKQALYFSSSRPLLMISRSQLYLPSSLQICSSSSSQNYRRISSRDPGAEAWKLGCIILNSFPLTTAFILVPSHEVLFPESSYSVSLICTPTLWNMWGCY